MLNKEREQEIINILKVTNGYVTVKYLCNTLFASESSIRRDLKSLERRGLIKRSYGGAAIVTNRSSIITFNQRTQQNINAKRLIAKKAATYIEEGNIIFLDQSSTSFYLANEIINRGSLTVVTNNTEILILLANSKIRVISSGGYLSDENRNCLIGGDARYTFENMYADMVFFSTKGLSYDGIITDPSREEIIVRNAMLKNADKKIFLCDSTKFGAHAPYKQCELGDVDYLISEEDKASAFSSFSKKLILI